MKEAIEHPAAVEGAVNDSEKLSALRNPSRQSQAFANMRYVGTHVTLSAVSFTCETSEPTTAQNNSVSPRAFSLGGAPPLPLERRESIVIVNAFLAFDMGAEPCNS